MTRESPGRQISAPPSENMLPAAEVARRLSLSLTAVYRLARTGEIRSHRMGKGKVRPRGLRVPESAVAEFLQASKISATDAA